MTLCLPLYTAVMGSWAPPGMALRIASYALGKSMIKTGPMRVTQAGRLHPLRSVIPVHACGEEICDCKPVAIHFEISGRKGIAYRGRRGHDGAYEFFGRNWEHIAHVNPHIGVYRVHCAGGGSWTFPRSPVFEALVYAFTRST